MKKEIKDAIAYVREQLDSYELDEIHAQIDKAYNEHLMPQNVCDYGHVIDLLNEYGYDHDIVDNMDCDYDWWEDNGNVDIDDILFEL